jgi:uncharacterized protein (UPF0264 family)
MVQMLISVKSVEEADIALQYGADIIDLKDPDQGALGALPISDICSIIDFVGARKPISATIGDMPMQPELIVQRVLKLQGLSINYIKIGFFEIVDYMPCLEGISKIKTISQPLIAVLFAEYQYPKDLIANIKQAGFVGIMLDTANKNGRTYQDYFSEPAFEAFANEIHKQNLLFGIAGSLQETHVKAAKKMNPHFMGFRGGVCIESKRQSKLDSAKIYSLKTVLIACKLRPT